MNTIVGYTANQLASSTSAAPAVVLTTGGNAGTGFPGLAFDASGNLWVAYNAAVVEYTACQLTASGNPKPNVTLTANAAASSLNNPVALAFDARGNLWVADDQGGTPGGNTLVEFTPSQLAASGSPTPAVTLSAINNPVGLAFDHSGNLWTSIGSLVEFSASQLTASGSPIPAVTLSDNGSGSLSGVSGLAFDGGGNLWVANGVNGPSIVEFASGQLGSTGSPTPAVRLTGANLAPLGLAFDGHGNLWVANILLFNDNVVEFAASQLMASGAPTPTVTLSGASITGAVGLAFAP
jgi:sugar lactone lactonase YvrE